MRSILSHGIHSCRHKPPPLTTVPTLIISRYLLREILKPLVVVSAVLVVIFVSYSSSRYLARAANGELPMDTIMSLLFLKALIALEVLLPITLFLSVVLGLGRMHADSEMTALSACGISSLTVVKVVWWCSLFLAFLVGGLSLFVRPWAYQTSYWLLAQAEAHFDVATLEPGIFYEKKEGKSVIFIDRFDRARNQMEGVFIQQDQDNGTRIIFANQGYLQTDPLTGESIPVLLNGHEYRLSRGTEPDRIAAFHKVTIHIESHEKSPAYKRKAVPTLQLAQSDRPQDLDEFQWRLSTPLSTILLGLLGIPLSRATPRQGKYAKLLVAVFIYALYYNVQAMARTWVKQGIVGPIPGIWWVDVLLAVLLVALLWNSTLQYIFQRH